MEKWIRTRILTDTEFPMTDNPPTIRGHHLFCILGFRGLGYDRRFVKNMGGVVTILKERPDEELILTDRCDVICSACPHNTDGRCGKRPGCEAVVQKADRAVLTRLGLRVGDRRTARQVYQCVATRVSLMDIERGLCLDCEWRELGFCKEGFQGLLRGEFFR